MALVELPLSSSYSGICGELGQITVGVFKEHLCPFFGVRDLTNLGSTCRMLRCILQTPCVPCISYDLLFAKSSLALDGVPHFLIQRYLMSRVDSSGRFARGVRDELIALSKNEADRSNLKWKKPFDPNQILASSSLCRDLRDLLAPVSPPQSVLARIHCTDNVSGRRPPWGPF